ncbi:MAG: hypothetical protein KDA35_08195 [Hyphomonadaceae bacterium]|nr:hypothetical protein [Hyphomonadaceae bacterium]
MNAAVISGSSLTTSLLRYGRSRALWLMLLVAPLGARYMLPFEDGGGIKIAVGGALPLMTSPFLGVSLGIIVSTLVLPVAWLYLRSNTTRRQPWQVEETTAGSRVAIALGRFAADAIVLLGVLAALNLAGIYLATFMLEGDALNIAELSFAMWVVAGPAMIGLAALRILFDARPLLRSGFGDFAYFCVWIGSITAPIVTDSAEHSSLGSNMWDFAGFVTPLKFGAPPGTDSFSIGGGFLATGTIDLDVMAGLMSPGYLESRLAWVGIAVAIVAIAGLIYAPHKAKKKAVLAGRLGALLNPGPPPRVVANAPAAKRAVADALGLVWSEFRLIGSGRVFLALAAIVAIISAFADFRHVASPAALLLLLFALSAHAGRSEARGLVALTKVAPFAPMARRIAFVVAGALWTTLMALPGAAPAVATDVLPLAAASGAVAATVAVALSTLTGSSFAARLVLLVLWYGYVSM